ncbi:Hsp33 family molecular chaperone HslO, partial [Anoxybacillus sp. LAT27]
CLAHYQQQSVQIPTLINLACDGEQAGGIVLQLLPRTTEEEYETVDNDLFPRLKILTKTLKAEELTTLPADEILYRLYHEEDVVTAEPM